MKIVEINVESAVQDELRSISQKFYRKAGTSAKLHMGNFIPIFIPHIKLGIY